jgi:phytoene dehydrogenase-like protein
MKRLMKRSKKKKRVIIAGAGISGLTAGAYLSRIGHDVLVLEKSPYVGGLVNSFKKDEFFFDTGPRAIGNAGILEPMLEDLKIELPLVKGLVSTGIKTDIIHYDTVKEIDDYIKSLKGFFPKHSKDIRKIEKRIRSCSRMTRTLNKAANPFFKNPLTDIGYTLHLFIPWLPSFLAVVLKSILNRRSIDQELDAITNNERLKDIVDQHFFKGTPAVFAFGYFENFQDYKYPIGGTSELPKALERKIISDGGVIKKNRAVVSVHPGHRTVVDSKGEVHPYDNLIWAANLRSLYEMVDSDSFSAGRRRRFFNEKEALFFTDAGESVLTLFTAVDESPAYFRKISRGHFIYTPKTCGLGDLHRGQLAGMKENFPSLSKQQLFSWLKSLCERNSYEISIPVLKDVNLAPPGKTGLVISILFDGELCKMIRDAGWMDEFKAKAEEYMLSVLDESVYPGIRKKIIFTKTTTPFTLMKMFNVYNGAITGWSLEGKSPVPNSLFGIQRSVKTSIPRVYKAGQWSYSPSGVPIAILTGRIAASAVDTC